MNPNLDFRSDEFWDDRSIQGGVGDDLNCLADFVGLLVILLICYVWV